MRKELGSRQGKEQEINCLPPLALTLPLKGTTGVTPLVRSSAIFWTSSQRIPLCPRMRLLARTRRAARVQGGGIVVLVNGSESGVGEGKALLSRVERVGIAVEELGA